MKIHIIEHPGIGREPSIVITDGKRFCQHSLESFSERPEYWWNEAHRALKEDQSMPYKGEYYTTE